MARVGRKRKSGKPRDGSGRIASGHDRERPDQITATVKAQRMKIVASEDWRSPEAESPLGRLLLAGKEETRRGSMKHEAGIDRKQYDALCHFRQVASAYSFHVLDAPSPNPPAMVMERTEKGAGREDDPETARKAKAAYDALYEAIRAAQHELGSTANTYWVISELVLRDRWPFALPQRRVAEIARVCGNHLDRVRTGLDKT